MSLDAILGPPEEVGPAAAAPSAPAPPRPEWEIQKLALARKFPDGWAPMKKLSHEAQDGLRLLHRANPERFSVPVLARRFRLSPESVRRILKSKWRPTEAEAQRQNERAQRAEMAARHGAHTEEAAEIAALRDGVPLDVAPRTPAPSVRAAAHEHPVRFEGLVSSADLADGKKRGKGAAARGSGDWCLIDAGWCVVHVVTGAARERLRLEELWRRQGASR